MLSELDPLWQRRSADVAVEEDELVEEDKGFAFSLKSVMMTVRSPTVTSKCWALLLSTFFNLGLLTERGGGEECLEVYRRYTVIQISKPIKFGEVLHNILLRWILEAFFSPSLQSIKKNKALLKIPIN